MDVKKKHEIEAALATEAQAVSAGQLKEENPLDLSDEFRTFCEACRRGDLKVCQEMISSGVNLNARDKFDYTPLILVSHQHDRHPRHCHLRGLYLDFPALIAKGKSVWSLRSNPAAA